MRPVMQIVTILGLFLPILAFGEGASIQLADVVKSSEFEVYCSDSSFIKLIQENDAVLRSEVKRLADFLNKEPSKHVQLADIELFASKEERRQIADSLFVNHTYNYSALGKAIVINSEITLRSFSIYVSALRLGIDPDLKPILDRSKMRAKVILLNACGVSVRGK